jgi:glutamate synthase (NADPH/NADH) small chain
MDAPEYIRSIWEGDLEEAVRWIYRTNPFSHVCGRVCTHRCEAACSIGRRGEPVAIRWLKRYAMDSLDHERVKEIAAEGVPGFVSGKRVAIIGSGPAGMTAAYDLIKKGHCVVVYEAQDKAGGMMRYGIPEYRLPYDRLDDDIDTILSLGVDLRLNMKVGKDISMEQLYTNYDAVLMATGLHEGRSTRIPGSDHASTVSAIKLLRQITRGKAFDIPKKAVIIGGGNVAMDIARSLARFQKDTYGNVDVTLTALEAREQMLADESEIRERKRRASSLFQVVARDSALSRTMNSLASKPCSVPRYSMKKVVFIPDLMSLMSLCTTLIWWSKRSARQPMSATSAKRLSSHSNGSAGVCRSMITVRQQKTGCGLPVIWLRALMLCMQLPADIGRLRAFMTS